MAPAPTISHQNMVLHIATQGKSALAGNLCQAFIAPVDVLLPNKNETDENAKTVVQPDLFVFCDPNKITERVICGAPDWVVEALSPATASRDHLEKRIAYEQAGVREYWLVHPVDKVLLIYRRDRIRYPLSRRLYRLSSADRMKMGSHESVNSLPALRKKRKWIFALPAKSYGQPLNGIKIQVGVFLKASHQKNNRITSVRSSWAKVQHFRCAAYEKIRNSLHVRTVW